MNCTVCNGVGKVTTEEWDREWNRFDRNSPSHYDTNRHMDRSGIEEYEVCPICKGEKEMDEVKYLPISDWKKAKIEYVEHDFGSYFVLKIDEKTFAKVPTDQVEITRRK